MSATKIEWGGEFFALLVESPDRSYIVPPIVFDLAGDLIQGVEVLQAIVESGVAVEVPMIRNATVGDLADIDQRIAKISADLGVPTIDRWLA